LRAQGWDIDLMAHYRRGGHVLGICGGYQMLGSRIADPQGIEGSAGETRGLGLLDLVTEMTPDKCLTRTRAVHAASGLEVEGYEIHIGRTEGADRSRPFAFVEGAPEGAISACGRVTGSYLHGLFTSDAFRAAYLAGLGITASGDSHAQGVEDTLEALADHLEAHLDVPGLLALAR
jgi:adenosylcobyric acid synthase